MKPSDRDSADRRAMRERLLIATLPHVVFDGWTETALRAGAVDADLDPIDGRRYFPGGPAEMVRFFSDWADTRMLAVLESDEIGALPVRERIAAAVRARLEALSPHAEAVRRGLGFLALPQNAPLAARCLYRTVDAAWYGIGDRSVDFSFYTKRALLGGVISATTLYWLRDTSDGHADTWEFLDRRIADVLRIGGLRGRAEKLFANLPTPGRFARAFAQRR